MFAIRGHGDLPVGPLAGQVDADARDDRGPVLQAEGGEVQTVGADKKKRREMQRSDGSFDHRHHNK